LPRRPIDVRKLVLNDLGGPVTSGNSFLSLLPGHSGGEMLLLALSAFAAGLGRGFSGFGNALIFMPLASAIVGPALAAPVLLIIDAIMAAGMLPNAWQLADRREVWIMSAGALIGIPAGTFILAVGDPLTLRWGIVLTVAVLLTVLISGWRFHSEPSPALTVGVGAVSGLFAGAAQLGGLPIVIYLLGRSISGAIVRANIVLYFAVTSVIAAVSYVASGLFTQSVIALAILAGPSYGVGLYLGSRLFGIASEATFRRACYALIFAAVIIGLPLFDAVTR
jgi:uncharacterized protein